MRIKDLLNYLGQLKSNVDSSFMIEPLNEVIGILENVEENGKYKGMWEELERYFKEQDYLTILGKMDYIKQKYFPSYTFQKDIKIEIRTKKYIQVDWAEGQIKKYLLENMQHNDIKANIKE